MKKQFVFALAIGLFFCSSTQVANSQGLEWARQAGGSDTDESMGLTTDGVGNSYITGIFLDQITFGMGEPNQTDFISSDTEIGLGDMFVAKYDSAGDLVWAKRSIKDGGSTDTIGQDIAIDASGDVFAVGYFDSEVIFGIGEGAQTKLVGNDTGDVFLAKYANNGSLLWARKITGVDRFDPDSRTPSAVSLDFAGNVYVTGRFEGTTAFGFGDPNATTLVAAGSTDVFIAKFDGNGVIQWARAVGGSQFEDSQDIAVDSSGNSYVTGIFSGTASFDPSTDLVSMGGSDIFVAKYDTNGALLWARQADGEQDLSIAVDGSGNSYTVGSFRGTAVFGTGESGVTSLSCAANACFFIAKYSSGGSFQWVRQTSGAGSHGVGGVAADASGNSYATGRFSNTAVFGAGTANPITLSPPSNLFIAKYSSAGTLRWATAAADNSFSTGIAIDSSTNIWITGNFNDMATFTDGTSDITLVDSVGGGSNIFVANLTDEPGSPPTAVAGEDQAIHAGNVVFLDGSGSFNDNTASGDLAYDWSFVSQPAGSTATLSGASTLNPTFLADLPGSYTVQLVVTDADALLSDPDVVTVSSDNLAPSAMLVSTSLSLCSIQSLSMGLPVRTPSLICLILPGRSPSRQQVAPRC